MYHQILRKGLCMSFIKNLAYSYHYLLVKNNIYESNL